MRRVVGTLEQTPRWKECATVLNAAMPYVYSKLLKRSHFKCLGNRRNVYSQVLQARTLQTRKRHVWKIEKRVH